MLDVTDPDRPKAMLTKDERRHLLNNWSGLDRNGRSYHQREIVKRIRHSLLDFSLLYEKLPENRRKEIFEIDRDPEEGEATALHNGVVDTVAFLYTLCEEPEPEQPTARYRPGDFEYILESAISRVESDQQSSTEDVPMVEVYLDIDVHYPTDEDLENAIDRMAGQTAATLNGAEARALLHAIDPDMDMYEGGHKAVLDRIQNRREEKDERWEEKVNTARQPDSEDTDNTG